MLGVGTVLGDRYRLARQLDEGGMGAVWRAEHVMLGREVAVKLLREDQRSPEAEARFMREARAAARVRHRAVVDIIDYGTHDGHPYIVMELLEGKTFGERLSCPPRPSAAEVVSIVAETLAGLDAVHAAGIIHRDLKPNNIFLAREGDDLVPKLLDFGISRPTEAVAAISSPIDALTRSGTIIGTPQFMSPEQARGITLDIRTDLWSMGVILYEALTGELPFDGETLGGMVIAIATEPPKPITVFCPDLPAELIQVVERALTRDREARIQSASEFRRALLGVMPKLAAGANLTGARGVDADAATLSVPTPAPSDISVAAPAAPIATPMSATIVPPIARRTRGRGWIYAAATVVIVGIGLSIGLWPHSQVQHTRPRGMVPLSTKVEQAIVKISLRGVPNGAVISVDGAPAQGPELTLPREERTYSIEVRAPNGASWRMNHDASRDGNYAVSLPPVAASSAPERDAPGPTRPGRLRSDSRNEFHPQRRPAAIKSRASEVLFDSPGF